MADDDADQKVSVLSNELIKPEEIQLASNIASFISQPNGANSFVSQPELGKPLWLSAAKEHLSVPPVERLKCQLTGIEKWKELGPLCIEEIMSKTNIKQPDELFMPGREEQLDLLENVSCANGRVWRGIFTSQSGSGGDAGLTGIGRSVTLSNWVYEGQVING